MRKRELYQSLTKLLRHYQRSTKDVRKDLKSAKRIDMKNAQYIVHLKEDVPDEYLGHHPPRRSTTEHRGSLTSAIAAAEREFREEHSYKETRLSVEDFPIRYSAIIKIGKRQYHVPERIVNNIAKGRGFEEEVEDD